MILKKDIGLNEFFALGNFIGGSESTICSDEVGGMILLKDGTGAVRTLRVVHFKGDVKVTPNGDEFGVTIEIEDRIRVQNRAGVSDWVNIPPRFLTNLLKALGSPLE